MIKTLSLFSFVSLSLVNGVNADEVKRTGNNQSRSNLTGSQLKNPTKTLPFTIDLKRSAILWSKLSDNPITIEEKLSMLSKNLENYDEFTRKKILAQTEKDFLDVGMELEKAKSFTFSIVKELRDYDFSKQGFPTDLKSDNVLIAIGSFSEPRSTSMFGMDEIVYYAKTDVPAGLDFIEMKEKDAEQLASFLQKSRNIEIKFIANLTNWIPSQTTEATIGKRKNRGLLFETSSVTVTLEEGNRVLKTVKVPAGANQPKESQ